MGQLRIVGAVVAGFVAMLIAVAGAMAVAMTLMGVHDVNAPPSLVFVGVLAMISFVSGILGGAVCAWLAGRAHPRGTLMLAIVVGALGAYGSLTTPPGQTSWHGWLITAMGVLGVVAGSFFWTRGRAVPSDSPRPMS